MDGIGLEAAAVGVAELKWLVGGPVLARESVAVVEVVLSCSCCFCFVKLLRESSVYFCEEGPFGRVVL